MWINKRSYLSQLTWTITGREEQPSRGAKNTKDLPKQEAEKEDRPTLGGVLSFTHGKRETLSQTRQKDRQEEGGRGEE